MWLKLWRSREILLEVDSISTLVKISADTQLLVAVEQELGKIGLDISFVPFLSNGAKFEDGSKVLQRWIKKFARYVDVTEDNQVCDGDRVTIKIASSGEDGQSTSQMS